MSMFTGLHPREHGEILRLDPATGRVTAEIDASGLLDADERTDRDAVLAGSGDGTYQLDEETARTALCGDLDEGVDGLGSHVDEAHAVARAGHWTVGGT